MKIVFSSGTYDSVKKFCDYYEDLYFQLYDDTGLGEVELLIKESYKTSAKQMHRNILDFSYNALLDEHLLGVEVLGEVSPRFRLVRTQKKYRLFIDYDEDGKFRVIQKITIYKK